MIRTCIAFALFLVLAVPPAIADERSKGAADFVHAMTDQVLSILDDDTLEDDVRKARFAEILTGSFDIRTIGRYTLGNYWRIASDNQREEFNDLLEDVIVDTYNERFADYSGETVEITGHRPVGKRDAYVQSRIVRPDGSPPLNIEWQVRNFKDGYKVIDVSVENISMTRTQKAEFVAVIERNGGRVQALLDAMRKGRIKIKG